MSIKDIQAKVHHNFNDTWNKDSTFQTAEGVIVQSALIFKSMENLTRRLRKC